MEEVRDWEYLIVPILCVHIFMVTIYGKYFCCISGIYYYIPSCFLRAYRHVKVHNVIKNSAMPRSHSNLHHSIERTQIDRWTLWKNENLSPIRGDIFLWSSRLPWSPPKFVMLATKCANFTGRFLHRQYISGKSDHCYWKNRHWGARLLYKIIFPTSFDIYFWSSNFVK